MGVFGNIGKAIKKAVSNPLQPITHAVGQTAGVTANLHNGVHIDPARIMTDLMAATGNPAAIAGVMGNAVNTVSPNSTLGHLGGTVGKYAPMVAGATGGMSGLTKIPGVGQVLGKAGSLVAKIPGGSRAMSALGTLGTLGAHGGPGAPSADVGGYDDGYGGVAGESASTMGADDAAGGGGFLNTILNNAKSEAGRVVRRVATGQSPISTGGSAAAAGGAGGLPGNPGSGISPLLLELLAGGSGVMGAQQYARMGSLQDKALATAEDSYKQRAPLRTAGMAGMTAAPVKLPQLSTGNPFQYQGASA